MNKKLGNFNSTNLGPNDMPASYKKDKEDMGSVLLELMVQEENIRHGSCSNIKGGYLTQTGWVGVRSQKRPFGCRNIT